ncbi:Npun_R1517 family heterocyst differentiation transcriptional regulator [Romeriopsis navalis]|nr:Npun_R1517 family heterocyst differentiation transcriptional regulator [Romeriopsis navalis]
MGKEVVTMCRDAHAYQQTTTQQHAASAEVGVYECEINLKFRLIEEKAIFKDRDQLLELLLEAFTYGNDEYMETLQVDVNTQAMPEVNASPKMRRQLIRLRNSKDIA